MRGVHGLGGAVRLEPLTDRPEIRFAVGGRLYREGDPEPLTIVEAARERASWRVRFAEVGDRTSAEALRGRYLEIEAAEPLPAGHVYWHELVGVTVRDERGQDLGRVIGVYRAGGAEVLSVAGPLGDLEVPVVTSVVRVFDPAGEGVVVDRVSLGLEGPGARPSPDEPGPHPGRGFRRRSGSGAGGTEATRRRRRSHLPRASSGVES